MIDGVELSLMYLLVNSMSSLEKCLLSFSAHFLIVLFGFWCWVQLVYLYILDFMFIYLYIHLYILVICISKYIICKYLPFCRLPFHFIDSFIWCTKSLQFDLVLFFLLCLRTYMQKKILLNQCQRVYCLYIFFLGILWFQVLHLDH